MINFLDFVEKSNCATSETELINTFLYELEILGYDRVLYTLATDHKSINKKSGCNIIDNYPKDWMEHYTRNCYFNIDPVVHHAAVNSKPFVWDKINDSMPLTLEQRRLINESKEAKLFNGVGLGIHCRNNEIAALGFAKSEQSVEETKTNISFVRLMANHFHAAYIDLQQKKRGISNHSINLNLTRKQIEVLQWAAAGKNNPDIALIMNINVETVSYHFREIFRKLEVNDRTLSVVMAIKYGLIHP